MNLPLLISGLAIGLIIGGVVLVLIAIGLAVYFLFFGRVRIKKNVNDLEARYERRHAVLFGADAQYLARLESISGMNLTYVDDYQTWKKRYSDVRDLKDAAAITAINNLRDYLNDGHYREAKEYIPEARKAVQAFEEAVESLDKGLSEKFADEDACKSLILSLQENLRNLRSSYNAKAGDLELVAENFLKAYGKLENLIAEANELVDDAKYSDARHILERKIEPVLKALTDSFVDLPTTCITLTRVLPTKIDQLEERYRELTSKNYPLGHLLGREEPSKMRAQVKELSVKASNYELRGVKEAANRLLDRIEMTMEGFEREAGAKESFMDVFQGAYRESEMVSEKYLDLRQAMPKIREIYVITPKAEDAFAALDKAVTDCQATKRNLDTYVHSAAKQPYSVLQDKARSLSQESQSAHRAIEEFQNYLNSLKEGASSASEVLKSFHERLRNAEACLRAMHCQRLLELYESRIDEEYAHLDELHDILSRAPIDVEAATEAKNKTLDLGTQLFNEIDALDTARLAAEKAIVIANRNRRSYPGAEGLLQQAEAFYFAGDYIRAEASAEQVATLRPSERQR